MGVVEKFAEDAKQVSVSMPNVWKRITPRNVTSDFFLVSTKASSHKRAESRRGRLDAIVAESEEEGVEDEEAVIEKTEERRRAVAGGRNGVDQATDDEEDEATEGAPLKTLQKKGNNEHNHQLSSVGEVKKEHLLNDKDIDDLMCLVCDASPRNAGVLHGLYLHVYCCYACAKRQHRTKSGCMVCDRPIDRVLRLLPLTLDARTAIRNQKKLQI